MAANPAFLNVIEQMRSLAVSKNHDYASDDNPFSNFEGAARLAGLTADQVFHTMIGIKVERLRQVAQREANHESLDDTLLDLANYAALWLAFRQAPVARQRRFDETFDKWEQLEGDQGVPV